MRVEIDLTSFRPRPAADCIARSTAGKTLYLSSGLQHVDSVDALKDSEYGQAVEVDPGQRTVRFGRDYLGHFPLLYACTLGSLYVSDDVSWIVAMLRAAKARLSLSEEALALYFSTGYVPAGMTVYKEIVACEPHTVYRWCKGRVDKTSTFAPIAIEPGHGLADLGRAIEEEVARCASLSSEIDVWCSGGIDSSIMACAFNTGGRRAQLLTVGYGSDIHEKYGDGERSYAYEVASHCAAPIREIELTEASFEQAHERFVATHHMPVIDACVPAKYALAQASRGFVITGEGSDPLFGGPKNNAMLFAHGRGASVDLGWHYAYAHRRSFPILGQLMRRGAALTEYVSSYLNGLLERYPGDLVRRLFYVNTHLKAASLIFTESFYACRAKGIVVRHPYAGLAVYRAAFALQDHFKYRYPKGKLALHALYAARLPRSILERKKSGTVLPFNFYFSNFAPRKFDFTPLLESGLFEERFVEKAIANRHHPDNVKPLYGLLTLNEWLKRCAPAKPRSEAVNSKRGSLEKEAAC